MLVPLGQTVQSNSLPESHSAQDSSQAPSHESIVSVAPSCIVPPEPKHPEREATIIIMVNRITLMSMYRDNWVQFK